METSCCIPKCYIVFRTVLQSDCLGFSLYNLCQSPTLLKYVSVLQCTNRISSLPRPVPRSARQMAQNVLLRRTFTWKQGELPRYVNRPAQEKPRQPLIHMASQAVRPTSHNHYYRTLMASTSSNVRCWD